MSDMIRPARHGRGRVMTDKPIIFSGPMVKAILEGRKSMTRRVLKPQPVPCLSWSPPPPGRYPSAKGWSRIPYAPGDRLWVKEAWRTDLANDHLRPSELDPGTATVWFDASSDWNEGQRPRYRNARFMPRWASRLTLTVTDVRVQRVQDISEADAVAEGIEPYAGIDPDYCDGYRDYCSPSGGYWLHPRGSFGTLWNTIHGPTPRAAWDANPWVAAYTFTVQRGNIDGGTQ